MNLKILRVHDNGVMSRERIVLKAFAPLDIGRYILCDTTYNRDDTVSNKLRHSFWFPDKEIKTGDFVVLYTTSGNDRQFDNKSDTVTHCFYWGLDRTVWNQDGDGAVLIEIGGWVAKNVLATT